MRKKLLFLMLLLAAVVQGVMAQEAYAVLSGDKKTVTFYYDNQRDERGGVDINGYIYNYPYMNVERAVIDRSFANYQPTSMAYWFYNCWNLQTITGLGYLDASHVTNMESMFEGCGSLYYIDLSSGRFNTKEVTNMRSMFADCRSLEELRFRFFTTKNVTDMSFMFAYCSALQSVDLSGFDTGNVTNMRYMFNNCSMLTTLNLSGFDTKNVTNMECMFSGCMSLESLDLSRFDTRNVTTMNSMFAGCSLASLDLSGFNTGNVTDMGGMFRNCASLASLNLSGFNTGNVTDMGSMFWNCTSLASLDLSGFNTGNVTEMYSMFSNCTSLASLDLSGFNTGNVTGMQCMFKNCSSLTSLDLSSFDTRKVEYTGWPDEDDGMFWGCESLSTIYAGALWNMESVLESNSMFEGCTSLVGGQGTAYDAGHTDAAYARIDGGAEAPGYLTGKGVTGIRTMENGRRTMDNYYTLDGRVLSSKPTAAGVYVTGGRKVIKN